MRDQTLMTSMQKGGGEVLKVVASLQMLLFLSNTSIILFCEWGGGCGGEKIDHIFFGHYNCMMPNVKKVMLLALVPVLK